MFSSSAAKAADYTPTWMRDKAKKAAAAATAAASPTTTTTTTTTSAPTTTATPHNNSHNNTSNTTASSNGSAAHASSISVTRTSSNTTSAVPWSSPLTSAPPPPPVTTSRDKLVGAAAFPSSSSSSSPPPPSSQQPQLIMSSPALSVTHTPTMMKRLPVRMSPMMMPSTRSHMNPNASEFVPGRGLVLLPTTTTTTATATTTAMTTPASAATADLHSGLDILPSTTADMEAKEQQQQQQQQQATRSPAWLPSHKRSLASSPVMAPVSLEQKSEAEILEISKRSALSVTAAAYVPRRTMTRVVLSKPSPLTLTPSADPVTAMAEMMLDDLWCLFYLPVLPGGKGVKEEDYNPLLVFRIDCIPTFWKVFNNVPTPSELQPSTLYLFRDGIDPKWEHAANRDGGIVKIKVSANDVDEAWEVLLCRTIGDSWAPAVRNTVNGVALKVRERAYLLEVWVTRQTPDLMKDLAALLQPILGATFATVYYPHSVMQERAHAAQAAHAERQSKQQQQQRRRY